MAGKSVATTADLRKAIAAEHAAAVQSAETAITHAVSCGRHLSELKAELPHGSFVKFVEENFDFTRQTASGYMRLAAAADAGELENASSIRGALKQLAPPKPTPPPADDRLGRAKELIRQGEASQRLAVSELMKAAEEEFEEVGMKSTSTGLEIPEGVTFDQWLRVGSVLKDLLTAVRSLPERPYDQLDGLLSPAALWDLEEQMGALQEAANERLAELRKEKD
jgi:hypothetical protein